jgi:hypothetical protein
VQLGAEPPWDEKRKTWRHDIAERHASGTRASWCGDDDRPEVHHRTYARLGFERQRDLIVLCHDCHRDHHRALILWAIRAMDHAPLGVTFGEVLEKVGEAGRALHQKSANR